MIGQGLVRGPWNALVASAATLLVVACSSGGGGAPVATVQLGFDSDSEDLLEDGSDVQVAVRLQLAGSSLENQVTVRVVDGGGGTAASGVDYEAFAAETLVFPAGSIDGTTRRVTITSLADSLVEGTETIVLELESPTEGTLTLATSTVSIADDDSPSPLRITVDTGSGAVEIGEAQAIDFEGQAVGAGPTSDVIVAVHNDGQSVVELSAVTLVGADDSEFVVTVDAEASALASLAGLPQGSARHPSPLVALGAEGEEGLRLVLDSGRLAELAALQRLELVGFAVPGVGEVDLALERVPSPWSADAEIRVGGQPVGLARELTGDLSLWRGTVVGHADSEVFLGLSSLGTRGWLRLGDGSADLVHVVGETSERLTPGGAESRVARADQLAPGMQATPTASCAGVRRVPTAPGSSAPVGPVGGVSAPGLPERSAMPSTSLLPSTCRVAFESDFQFWNRFGDTNTAVVYVTQLVAAVSEQYVEDVQTSLEVVYLNLHEGPTPSDDPWSAPDSPGSMTADDLLTEFEDQWSGAGAPLAPDGVEYDIAHFLSGAHLGGGIAYVGVLCHPELNLGVSTEMTGAIDFEAFNGQPDNLNWDFVVVAHEIGHNFGADHTQDYCPPLDQCAPSTGDCSEGVACGSGTLMSYCHLCQGATNNVLLQFHPTVADIMRQSVNASCLPDSSLPGGAAVAFRVRFDPEAPLGDKVASLRFVHGAESPSSPFTVGLLGTAE